MARTKAEIEALAAQILKDHNLLNVPVDPLQVAAAENIKVMNAKFSEQDKSGVIAKRGNTVSIYLNYEDPAARKRFTIAHELGHFLLHIPGDDNVEYVDSIDNFRSTNEPDAGWTPERRKEWEANVFAAALLMNEMLIRREWSKQADVAEMAWRFQVSKSAMTVRLTSLGLLEPV